MRGSGRGTVLTDHRSGPLIRIFNDYTRTTARAAISSIAKVDADPARGHMTAQEQVEPSTLTPNNKRMSRHDADITHVLPEALDLLIHRKTVVRISYDKSTSYRSFV